MYQVRHMLTPLLRVVLEEILQEEIVGNLFRSQKNNRVWIKRARHLFPLPAFRLQASMFLPKPPNPLDGTIA